MSKNILFADNDSDYLSICAEFLEAASYKIFKASKPLEVQHILEAKRIHLAILDLRLTTDSDEKDRSGIRLAKEIARPIPKLILTKFPTVSDVRKAMKFDKESLPPVVDFVDKKAGLNHLLTIVEHAFTQHVRINWDLTIRWSEREHLSFPHLISIIESDLDNAHLPDRTGEIEDLFRKLFYDYDQITLSRLLWSEDGRLAVEVFAYSETNDEQFIVTCGRPKNILLDRERYKNTAPKDYKATSTSIALTAETMHFAVTAWTIPGVNIEKTNTFADFYHRSTSSQVCSTMEHLFQDTLAPWLQSGRSVDENNTLPELHRKQLEITLDTLPQPALERKILALCKAARADNLAQKITFDNGQLMFQFTNGEIAYCLNPLPYIYEDTLFPTTDSVCGTIPGNVDIHNILVDTNDGSTLLTDFSRAGVYPIWQDAISLETSLRFETMEISDLFGVYEFEEQLLNIHYLSDKIPSSNLSSAYKRFLIAIQEIRHQTAKTAGEEPLPYYIGLLFFTISDLLKYDPDIRQSKQEIASLVHRLLFAGMLCKKVAQLKDIFQPKITRNIRIDEDNRQAWIGEREANLTPTEFDLLLFLYQHAGQLCTRSDILEGVFGYVDADPDTEKSLLNTHVGRLRKKIEMNTSNPKYIITVRGEGYKLIPDPE